MSDLICITNRKLCKDDFLERIEKIADESVHSIILREKDMNEDEYRVLAECVFDLCKEKHTKLFIHTFYKTALSLKCNSIHVPLSILRQMDENDKTFFENIGTSCHSVSDAIEAQKLGCTYIVAGHVFETDCKKGIPGRGLEFLKEVCHGVSIPVYAIGGISSDNYEAVKNCGAKGACIMSGLMQCEDVKCFLEEFSREV